MNHIIKTILFVALILIVIPASKTFCQDLTRLLKAVEQIEADLKALVDRESKTRQDEIARLEKLLSNEGVSADNTVVTELKQQITELQKQLSSLSSQGNSLTNDGTLVEIINDMEFMKSEIVSLKNLVSNNSTLLASNQGTVAVSNQDQLITITEDLTKITEDLNEISKQYQHNDKPSKTKLSGNLYSHTMVDMSEGSNNYNEFAISRAYVTLKSDLSEHTKLRLTTDLKEIDGKYDIILKYAYLDWSPSFSNGITTIRLGLQPTLYIDIMNKMWGRRYLMKTIGDQEKFLTSSDLGFSIKTNFGPKAKYGFASVTLFNGTSYSDVEEKNKQKDVNIVVYSTPLKNVPSFNKSSLMLQFYDGTQNKETGQINDSVYVTSSDWKRTIFSVGGLFSWNDYWATGFDLNFTSVGENTGSDAVSKKGMSFFTTFYLNKIAEKSAFFKTLNLFARVDSYDPNTDISDNAEVLTVFGVESNPVKDFSVSFNYRITTYEADNLSSNKNLYINTLFEF